MNKFVNYLVNYYVDIWTWIHDHTPTLFFFLS